LSNLSPSNGPAGTVVALAGSNLTGVTGVAFGSVLATSFACDGTGSQCTATAPSNDAGTTVGVIVLAPAGASAPLSFTYSANAAVASVTANPSTTSGSSAGSATAATTPAGGGSSASGTASITEPSSGLAISYPTGWSIVAGPAGTVVSGNMGSLYTFQANNTAYQIVTNGASLQAGQGYWAYFPAAANSSIPQSGPQTLTATLPAGQYVMIGNPGGAPATVTGADSVVIFDPSANGYVPASTLAPGQGAWAISINGGTATIGGP
jgi:hypothetical protein